jgi:hypothetical protein
MLAADVRRKSHAALHTFGRNTRFRGMPIVLRNFIAVRLRSL